MATNVLKRYAYTTVDTNENTLATISAAFGERIGSLRISNNAMAAGTVTIKIKNSALAVLLLFKTESIPASGNLVSLAAFDKLNCATGDIITVQSSVAGMDCYLSTEIGVQI